MKKSLKLLILSSGLLVLPVSAVLAIGQMSRPIIVENAIRGQEILETLTLYSSEAEDKEFGLIAEGQIAAWAKFYHPDDENLENPTNGIMIPANSNIDAIVVFTVPEDTPNGTYTGEVSLTSVPPSEDETEGSKVSVMQKVGREVTITVTDQEIIDFEVSVIPEDYEVAKNQPLKIRFIYGNLGNVKIAPQVQIKIKDIDKQKVLYNSIFPYPEGVLEVKPGARFEIPEISVPTTGLENGKYWVELEISVGEAVKQESFRFQVGRSGRILGAAFSAFNSGMLQKVGLILLVVLAVGLGMAISNYRTERMLSTKTQKTQKAQKAQNHTTTARATRKTARQQHGFIRKLKEGRSWVSGFFS